MPAAQSLTLVQAQAAFVAPASAQSPSVRAVGASTSTRTQLASKPQTAWGESRLQWAVHTVSPLSDVPFSRRASTQAAPGEQSAEESHHGLHTFMNSSHEVPSSQSASMAQPNQAAVAPLSLHENVLELAALNEHFCPAPQSPRTGPVEQGGLPPPPSPPAPPAPASPRLPPRSCSKSVSKLQDAVSQASTTQPIKLPTE